MGMSTAHAQQLQNLWYEIKSSYPGVQVGEHKILSALKNQNSVRGERFPQLKMQAQNTYATQNGIAGAFFPQPGLFNVNGKNGLEGTDWNFNAYASATVEFEIFSFGKLKNKYEAAKANTYKLQQEQEAYLLQLQKELSTRYLELLYNQSRLESNAKNVDRLNTVRTITSALAGAGLKTAADSLLSSSSYNQVLGENRKLSGKREAAMVRLQELTGNHYNISLPSIKTFLDPVILRTPISISTDHPFLTSLKQENQRLDYLSRSESSKGLPSIKMLGGYAYRGSGIGEDGVVTDTWKDGFSNTANNALIGIGLTWNLTDIYTQKQRSNSINEQAVSQDHLYEKYKLQRESELIALHRQIENQFSEVQKMLEAEAQAQQAYEMYLARYKSGLMDLNALLQIQMLLEQAENRHLTATFEYWTLLIAEAELLGDFEFVFNHF